MTQHQQTDPSQTSHVVHAGGDTMPSKVQYSVIPNFLSKVEMNVIFRIIFSPRFELIQYRLSRCSIQ